VGDALHLTYENRESLNGPLTLRGFSWRLLQGGLSPSEIH